MIKNTNGEDFSTPSYQPKGKNQEKYRKYESVGKYKTESILSEEEFNRHVKSSSNNYDRYEKCLECTPKSIIFNNYQKDKVYTQTVKITNVGLEPIHCRYFGITVHTKVNGCFPIGVAVRDNVILRSGLVFCTKIRLCNSNEEDAINCSIVYETRRRSQPYQHSYFLVPVSCVPARAIVQITPLRIIQSVQLFSEKYHIIVPPFTIKNIHVKFIPEYKGFHEEIHIFQFENCYNCLEEKIELIGDIKKIPLIVEPEIIDFKICVANSGVYSTKFKVTNVGKGPFSVCVKISKLMKKHVRVYPKETLIQSNTHCDFSVRLHPR
ncbi:hypothetical protein Phum_PHUM450910 [Pediculus humanus corporis]|uniref:CFAP74 third Ig-like domain-containing protein n=1 Tax=Pediculus humanus subsp. corporis TaxID=121224 RepID=E0VUI5_PEDHC|nr:uncharacterized protein Phum_PHUM450910 [Pediculus humanus corporis]EEB17041.1 hypothetical protein Phum_PHUM450910 [Pediculus humanus corporis]